MLACHALLHSLLTRNLGRSNRRSDSRQFAPRFAPARRSRRFLGALTLPSPASRARRAHDSDLPDRSRTPRPRAGCSALLGCAAAPRHRQVPPPHSPQAAAKDAAIPAARKADAWGGQGDETSLPAATGRRSRAGVHQPMFCLPLTDPASRQQAATFTSAP
jgi:hypothetical protein